MKLTLNWLRELVESPLAADELAELLTGAGLEIDAVDEQRPVWREVEVAELLEVAPHPNADRLQLCRVQRGSSVASVVCGARNMQAGDKVALAVPGAVLPGDRAISLTKIRGVTSEGMLCAADELALDPQLTGGDGSSGIMILPPSAPLGTRLVDYLGAEDTVLELGITPNRGDCLSILGVAREVAALTGARLLPPAFRLTEERALARSLAQLDVEAPDLCPRYAARVVRGVRIAPSPPWMQTRLGLVGLRPINNIVDATNYVMIERGQPLHAFDHAHLTDGRIVVRRAGQAGTFATLDGVKQALVADDLVIADGRGPVALAGIMGGANSEISDATVDVLVESAFFEPATVRRTARRLGLMTDASYRFERGVDPSGTADALDRVTALLVELAGGTVARGRIERQARRRWTGPAIRLRPARVNALLGTSIKVDRMRKVLRALGAAVTAGSSGALKVVPPAHRFDLRQEVDLVEEVARVTGYDAIEATVPAIVPEAGRTPEADDERTIRTALRGMGLHEMVTLSMVAAAENEALPGLDGLGDTVPVANPLSTDADEMRRSLLSGLLRALVDNERQGEALVTSFSVGRAYGRGSSSGAYREPPRLGIVMAGTWPARQIGEGERPCGFGDVKGAVQGVLDALRIGSARWEPVGGEVSYLHPGKAARVLVEQDPIGVIGALHPDLTRARGIANEPWVAELDLQKVAQYCPRRVIFQPLPRFPAVQRDVAVVVDAEFQAQRLLDTITEVGQPLVEEARVFDQYTGDPIPDGKKSLAYAVSYRASDRTLTDEEVNAVHQELVEHLVQRLPLEVRR